MGSITISADILKIRKCDDQEKSDDPKRRQHVKYCDLLKINKSADNDCCNDQIKKSGRTPAKISHRCHVQEFGKGPNRN